MYWGNIQGLSNESFRAQIMSVCFKCHRSVAIGAKNIHPGLPVSLQNGRMRMPEHVRFSGADNGIAATDVPDKFGAAGVLGAVMRNNQDIAF